MQAGDGTLYGTAAEPDLYSGTYALFKILPGGSLTELQFFDGSAPAIFLGVDGNVYGATFNGNGTIFKIASDDSLVTVTSFPLENVSTNQEDIIQGRDGNFYGAGVTTIFKVTPDGEYSTLGNFDGLNATRVASGLRQGKDGNFYGVKAVGGQGGDGVVFKFTPAGQITILVNFQGSNGEIPGNQLVETSNGYLLGTTARGGTPVYLGDHGAGTWFSVSPDGRFFQSFTFNYAVASGPSGLAMGTDGNIYGVAGNIIFKISGPGVVPVATLSGSGGSSLIAGTDGNFYGTASGQVFKMTPAGAISTVSILESPEPGSHFSDLVRGADGNFYGTSDSGSGAVFRLSSAGAYSLLGTFDEGLGPSAPLLLASDGNFYGSTYSTVFKMTSGGAISHIADRRYAQGLYSRAPLVMGTDGDLYGITESGGDNVKDAGTLFQVTPDGTLSTPVVFNGTNGSGGTGLLQASDGYFYGTTLGGGTSNKGTIFRMAQDGTLTTLVSFNSANGASPQAGLIEGADGNLYGTTGSGGVNGDGTIFRMTPGGTLTTLVNFDGNNGASPEAKLTQGPDGSFYGTTYSGGVKNAGTAFRVTRDGNLTTLHSFDRRIEGEYPFAGLTFGEDGNLYGVTDSVAYRLILTGAAPEIRLQSAGVLSATGATISSLVTPNLVDTMVTIQYGTTKDYGTVILGQDIGSGSDYVPLSSTLTNLAPHTLYHFSVTATNSQGSVTGPDATFLTVNTNPTAQGVVVHALPIGVDAVIYTTAANTSDADGDVVKIIGLSGGTEATISADQSAVHFINPGFVGLKQYTVQLSDGFGGTASSVITVKNFAPVASNITIHAPPIGADTVIFSAAVNASDSDGDAVKITGLSGGPEATVSADQTTVHFINPGFAGSKQYTVQLSDGFGGTASSVITVKNFAPVASNITIHAPPVGNDTVIYSAEGDIGDADGDSVVVTSVAGGNGEISVSGDGKSLHYLNPGFVGNRSYTVTVMDDRGATATAELKVTNSAPVSDGESFIVGFGESATLPTSALGTDPDLDVLTIDSAGPAAHGTVVVSGNQVIYTAAKGYVGPDQFDYQLSDGHGAHTVAQATVEVASPSQPAMTHVMRTFSSVPGAGEPGSGIPAGALFKTFGSPAVNNAAQIAFVGSWDAEAGGSGVFLCDTLNGSKALAVEGQTAPDANGTPVDGATFTFFEAPVLDEEGRVGFLASLAGAEINSANNHGVYLASEGILRCVARTGDDVSLGVFPNRSGEAGRFKSFQSIALNEGNLLVAATLVGADGRKGQGGITSKTNTGIWSYREGASGMPVVQKGAITEAAGAQFVKSYFMLNPVNGSPGQYRFQSGDGGQGYVMRVTLSDNAEAIVGDWRLVSGMIPTGLQETMVQSMGVPAVGKWSTQEIAYAARLKHGPGGVTALNDAIILKGAGEVVARAGNGAPEIEDAVFKSFFDPVCNSDGEVAFVAGLRGKGVAGSSNAALYLQEHDLSGARTLALVAQKGTGATGVPGAVFSEFRSVALPDLENTKRVYFVAKLGESTKKGSPPAKLDSKNNLGLWSRDSSGNLQLLVRTGDYLPLDIGPRQLRSFSILSAVEGATGQARSFNDQGGLVFNAYFIDGSQAIMTVQVP